MYTHTIEISYLQKSTDSANENLKQAHSSKSYS